MDGPGPYGTDSKMADLSVTAASTVHARDQKHSLIRIVTEQYKFSWNVTWSVCVLSLCYDAAGFWDQLNAWLSLIASQGDSSNQYSKMYYNQLYFVSQIFVWPVFQ